MHRRTKGGADTLWQARPSREPGCRAQCPTFFHFPSFGRGEKEGEGGEYVGHLRREMFDAFLFPFFPFLVWPASRRANGRRKGESGDQFNKYTKYEY